MDSSARAWAVIVAAGEGRRFGARQPKQFASLAGKPMVLWSIGTFLGHRAFRGATLVIPDQFVAEPPAWLAALKGERLRLAAGGAERTDSVRLGLETVPRDIEFVAVHDGARPLITAGAIDQVMARVAPGIGAVAGRRVTDSLKEADEQGRVLRAVERERLWRAETPQIFPRELIVDVHRDAQAEGVHLSDCAALCERYGVGVVMVEIDGPNPKVTRPEDMDVVEALMRRHALR